MPRALLLLSCIGNNAVENKEYGSRHDHAHTVEDEVIDVEAAAEYRLQ